MLQVSLGFLFLTGKAKDQHRWQRLPPADDSGDCLAKEPDNELPALADPMLLTRKPLFSAQKGDPS